MNDHEPVIVGALRTPVGKRGGRLHKWHPVDLMAETLRQLVERSGVNPADPPSRRRSLLAWLERARRAGRVFDSTCGYPGEGPPRRSWSERAAMRPAARLADGGVRPATLSLRASAGSDFDVFLAVTGRPSAAELAAEARSFDAAMIEYLQELWQRGAPRSVALATPAHTSRGNGSLGDAPCFSWQRA